MIDTRICFLTSTKEEVFNTNGIIRIIVSGLKPSCNYVISTQGVRTTTGWSHNGKVDRLFMTPTDVIKIKCDCRCVGELSGCEVKIKFYQN
jgi:hypothetical protein